VLDCFLGNTGIEQSKGKVIDKASSYGSLYRLNNSGTMMFNLDGSVNEKFGNTVPELDDFRSSEKTPTTSFIYNDIEEEPLLNQIRGIKENFTDSIIKEYVNSCFKDNPEIEKKLVETLIARKNYIVNYGSQIAKKGLDKLRPKRTEKFNIPPVQEPGDITPDEKSAIKEYTGSDYASINRYLRGTGYQDEEGHQKYLPVVKQMVSGLKKYPVYHGKVFRGCDIDENTLSIVTSLKSNDVFYMKAFSSTSKNQYKSFSGKIKFTILSKTGRNIEGNSYSPLEEEILFAPDTRFKVTEINIKSGYDYQISLEEILPDEMRDVAPVNSDKKAPLTPEKIREFLLKNPKLTPAQREKIMTLSEEDLKKVMIAIFSKTKGKGSKNGEEISDKFTEVFV